VGKNSQIAFEDILWLRRAATKSGAEGVPQEIARKLLRAGLIEREQNQRTLKITGKGRIALAKLG
jgi:hypothetical protein